MMQAKRKYQNKKVEIRGIKFDSKLESNIYLKILELAKTYKFDYKLQPRYLLVEKFDLEGKKFRAITYVGDFELVINGQVYTIDSKGIETQVFSLKKKLFAKVMQREIICVKSVRQFVEWFKKISIQKEGIIINRVILKGRLTKDPELKYTNNSLEVCNFTVAVNRKFKNKSGEYEADFINCIAWKQTAKIVNDYFKKGNQILLEGSIQTSSYTNNDGGRVYKTEVLVESVEFIDPKSSSTSNTGNTYQANNSDSNLKNDADKEYFKKQESSNPFEDVGDFNVRSDDLPF